MKFDKSKLAMLEPSKPTEPASIRPQTIEEKPKQTSGLECVYCEAQAKVMHKGTSYCRACYTRHNWDSSLVN